MKQVQTGSTILIVVIFMGILAIIGLSAFKSSIFLQHFAFQRENLMLKETLAKSLLNYGVAVAQSEFEMLCKNGKKRQIELVMDQGIGRVILLGSKDSIDLTAQLEEKGTIIYGVNCRIYKNSDQKLAIEGFQKEVFPL